MKNIHSKGTVTIGQSPVDGSFWKLFSDDRQPKPICGEVVGDQYLPLWYLKKIKGTDRFNFTFPNDL